MPISTKALKRGKLYELESGDVVDVVDIFGRGGSRVVQVSAYVSLIPGGQQGRTFAIKRFATRVVRCIER